MEREKVLNALRCHAGCEQGFNCENCDYIGYSNCSEILAMDVLNLLKEQEEIIHCKDCYYYHKPEYGFTIGDCTYRTAWYPVKENEFCSLAKRKEGR